MAHNIDDETGRGTDVAAAPSPFVRLAATIVSAYIGNNTLLVGELSGLLDSVHEALKRLAEPSPAPEPQVLRPAVPVKKSITPNFLICLEDGKRFKSLKRHLRARYNMSPDEYRAKWGLSADYPMVAPAYARERSQLAKEMGLGQQRRRPRR